MDGPQLCQRIRVNTVESIGVGAPQEVPYVCAQVASVEVAGETVCLDCAGKLRQEHDATRIRDWGHTVTGWAAEVQHRPEVASWLLQLAAELVKIARAVEKGHEQ